MIFKVEIASLTDTITHDEFAHQFKPGAHVQLLVDDKQTFFNRLDEISEILSFNNNRIQSLRGPLKPTDGSTLFEDTVQIATKLEDYFDIDLKYITTSARYGWRSVAELHYFYEEGTNIYVQDFGSPIDAAIQIRTAEWTNLKMSYDGRMLPAGWFDQDVLSAFAPLVGEIDMTHCGYYPGNLLTFLEEHSESFYVML